MIFYILLLALAIYAFHEYFHNGLADGVFTFVVGGLLLFFPISLFLSAIEPMVKGNVQNHTRTLYSLEPGKQVIGRGQYNYHYRATPGALVTDYISGDGMEIRTTKGQEATYTWTTFDGEHHWVFLPSWNPFKTQGHVENRVINLPEGTVLTPIK